MRLELQKSVINILIITATLLILPAYAFLPVKAQSLAITGIQQKAGVPGTQISVQGNGFNAVASNNSVQFLPVGTNTGTSVTADSLNGNILYATVPSGATPGLYIIEVTAGGSSSQLTAGFQVLSSNSGGTFLPKANTIAANAFSSSDWGDLDQDGDLDLAMTGSDSDGNIKTAIYLNGAIGNSGNGFTELNTSLPNVGNGTIKWVDFDNDGDLDVFISGSTNNGLTTDLYENDGSNNFSRVNSGTFKGLFFSDADWGDLDGDGDKDLVLMGSDQFEAAFTLIYQNDGNGNFTEIPNEIANHTLGSLDLGDFDTDGDLDIAISGRAEDFDPSTKIYRNDGSGTFTDQNAGLTAVENSALQWADYDLDGDLDIVVAGSQTADIYQNNDNTFTNIAASLSGISSGSLDWADIDGDKDPDLAVSGFGIDGPESRIYRNDGNNTFTDLQANLTNLENGSLNWVDINNDGLIDLFAAGNDENFNAQSKIYQNANSIFRLTGIQQKAGVSGSRISITGLNFDNNASSHTVAFLPTDGGSAVSVQADSLNGSMLHATVPTGLTAGSYNIRVTRASDGASYTYPSLYQAVEPGGGDFEGAGGGLVGVRDGSTGLVDFDNDGDLDILITGTGAAGGTTTLYVNDGNNTFTELTAGLPDVTLGSIDWGDFDSDRDLDLVITGTSGIDKIARIYRNDSNGFTDIKANLNGVDDGSSNWVDYNQDGALDLLITGSGRADLYRNDGQGSFNQVNTQLDGVTSSSSDWADFDNDGDLDVVITGLNNSDETQTTVYENSNGSFNPIFNKAITTQASDSLQGVHLGNSEWNDFDRDGDHDLLITGQTEFFTGTFISKVYRNDNGAFTDVSAGLTGVENGTGTWTDINGDGYSDILLAGNTISGQPTTELYRNNQDSSFTELNTIFPALDDASSAWGDLDNNGTLDLVITGLDKQQNQSIAQIYYNQKPPFKLTGTQNDHGIPGTSITIKGIGFALQAATNEITLTPAGDGNQNSRLITADSLKGNRLYGTLPGDLNPGTYQISVNNGSTDAMSPNVYHVVGMNGGNMASLDNALNGTSNGSVDWGDYNKDGSIDLVVTGSDTAMVYKNNGDSTFTDIAAGLEGVENSASDWGDFDLDGDLDLVIAGRARTNGTATIYENGGNDTFTALQANLQGAGVSNGSVNWVDYNNDGYLDLFITGSQSANLYKNNTDGSFSSISVPIEAVSRSDSDWADFNKDGRQDVAVMGENTQGQSVVHVYRNDGGDSFSQISTSFTGLESGSVDWADFNNDNLPDLLLSGRDNSANPQALVYRNDDGKGGFTDIQAGLNGLSESYSQWGDFNGDGLPDIAITGLDDANSTTTTTLYQNNGNGNFSDIGAGLSGPFRGDGDWGDFNNDGFLDLILVGSDFVFFYQNGEVQSTANEETVALPQSVELEQNYPNPFNPSTNISFALPQSQRITLEVYDMLGRQVQVLADNQMHSAGSHTIEFNARGLSSGVYIYRLRTSTGKVLTKKLTLIK